MPAATPIYGFPYPVLGDSPHGPNQLEDLAEAVEAALADTDADVAALGTARGAFYYQTGTAQSVPTGVDQRILFNSNLRTHADISAATVSGGTEFTINTSGLYIATASVRWTAGANNTERYIAIGNSAAGSEALRYAEQNGVSNTPVAALPICHTVAKVLPLTAGMKICCWAFQADTGAVSLTNAATYSNSFALARLGA